MLTSWITLGKLLNLSETFLLRKMEKIMLTSQMLCRFSNTVLLKNTQHSARHLVDVQ